MSPTIQIYSDSATNLHSELDAEEERDKFFVLASQMEMLKHDV
jgi:hypothetical protein